VPVTLALVFHFNQHIREHALLASQVCYRGLLRVLRAHPAIKANIHISGTLIQALRWLDPEPLDMIREGLADRQFELLGSTYAQNVAYASDDWDNARQIELHQETLQEAFGVIPSTFWLAERCWRQSLVPLIAGAGYRTTLIEDHILADSGAPGAQVYATRLGDEVLKLVCDDEQLKHHFNFAAWFGQPGGLHRYLDSIHQAGGRYLAYAEDAEAMGLWGYGTGVDPEQTWERLGKVLDELAARPDLETGLLSQAPEPVAEQSPIQDGCARWMDVSLQQPGRPYHEDGYSSWFDFNARSLRLARYRALYGPIRAELRSRCERYAQAANPSPAAEVLLKAALHTFLAHQYEFGCIGIGAGRYRGWEGVRAARALALAADWADSRRSGLWVEDVNEDGHLEACLSDGRQALITSPLGGRLLYWFDLETGCQLIGNPLGVAPGEYQGDSVLPPVVQCPNLWTPDSPGNHPPVTLHQEDPPTRLGRYLPGWIWEGQPVPVILAGRDIHLPGERSCLTAQRRALVDELQVDGEIHPPGEALEMRLEGQAVIYNRHLTGMCSLEKRLSLEPDGIRAVYRFSNPGQAARRLSLLVSNELCPGYSAVLRYGREALNFSTKDGFPAVVNLRAGEGISVQASRSWKGIVQRKALLALELCLAFEYELPPASSDGLELRLVRSPLP
jgi:hypothetical protein